jgi:hypothetical protein
MIGRRLGSESFVPPGMPVGLYAIFAHKKGKGRMTGRDLRAARGKLVGNGRGAVKLMAEKLETPYRTYQGWEARKGLIPGVAGVAVKALIKLSDADQELAEFETVDEVNEPAKE